MPKHPDFQKIHKRFVKQYGKEKGDDLYYAWLNKHHYDDTKAFPKKEKKEIMCAVRGFEIKENDLEFHIEGLIATSHIDNLDIQEGVDVPDMIPKQTLESFANQINTLRDARIMGIHHSEGRPINPEFFGEADVKKNPARVIQLNDGEWGLYVDTRLLKNDPQTSEIISDFENGKLNSFSITYDTNGFMTTDFDWVGDNLVRVLLPETRLYGYTAASNPVNPNAVTTSFGFKEFKELVGRENTIKKEVEKMPEKETKEVAHDDATGVQAQPSPEVAKQPLRESEEIPGEEEAEQKEFKAFKADKKAREEKEFVERTVSKIAEGVLSKMEIKEKVLKDNNSPSEQKEISLELKEFREVITNPGKLELKEQFRRAAALCDSVDSVKLDWRTATTSAAESRDYKTFGVKGRHLEYKGLGITTNQSTDTDYLQSSAELQDIYDPVIYNALNQVTVTWNLLAKDDFSKKGNNQVQFTLKTAANTSATFYLGNAVTTANVTRLKYQTKFKKLQVGVAVDGDMIAAARGGPVSDVFAQEVMDSTLDMLAVLNVALFAEVGLETASAIIGFEYITDSAGNTSLYNYTRSTTNRLAPDSAGDTYISGASVDISMTNLRAGIRQSVIQGANKANLVYITHPIQADKLRGQFDDSRRMLTSKDTDFGFSTDLFVDGIPIFEDKDCNSDDWFLVDLETHRVALWVPPTIERLGKTADSEDAFIKMYLATYNRSPRRMVQIYGNAIS